MQSKPPRIPKEVVVFRDSSASSGNVIEVAVTTDYTGNDHDLLNRQRYDLAIPDAPKPSWFGLQQEILLTSKGLAIVYDSSVDWMSNLFEHYMAYTFAEEGIYILPSYGKQTGYGLCMARGVADPLYPAQTGAELNRHASKIFGFPIYGAIFLLLWDGIMTEVEPELRGAISSAIEQADVVVRQQPDESDRVRCFRYHLEGEAPKPVIGNPSLSLFAFL